MRITERFIEGKNEDCSLCEDEIFVSDDFIAVIDGVTAKNGDFFNGLSGGKAAALKVAQALNGIPFDADCYSAVEKITEAVASLYTENREKGVAAASVIVYSVFRNEIWSVGDCQCIIGGDIFLHEKEIDRVNSEFRSLVLECEKRKGVSEEELSENDTGRAAIMPVLNCQHIFANSEGKYSYGIINGTRVPKCHIIVHKVKQGDEVILASDGYPHLKTTLQESEMLLKEEMEKNPLCIKGYISTKGMVKGNKSFDDRAYIKFRVEV